MTLNLATFNVRGIRCRSKASRVVRDLVSLKVDIAAIQETHFVCDGDCQVLVNDYDVYSAYGNTYSRGISLLVSRTLSASVNVVHAGEDGRLLVVDVAVNCSAFRIVAVYAPNSAVERASFFRRLEGFLVDPERLVLMGDWNAILDPNIDKVGGASGSVRCDSTLSDLMASCDLVDRFRLDHPGREMWTWHPVVPSHPSTYLDRMLVRRGDVDFLSCPTFHLLGHSDHKLVMARLNLSARPKLAGYWKFNSTLLELEDYRLKVTELIQRALVGAVTGSKWWVSLKAKIRRFSVQYSQRLALDKAKAKKRLEDKMTRAVEGGVTP